MKKMISLITETRIIAGDHFNQGPIVYHGLPQSVTDSNSMKNQSEFWIGRLCHQRPSFDIASKSPNYRLYK